jgi:5'-nucleotidase
MILVSNDDGIHSEGLSALREAAATLGDEVVVVAPDRERSAVSHSLTLHRPLRVEEVRPGWFAVDGTPTDCVLIAIHRLLAERPRLVVAGINRGANLGDDVHYSGTVSAAKEATLLGIPSIAFSLGGRSPFHFEATARFASRISAFALEIGLPPNTLLNVNFPPSSICEAPERFVVTRLGRRRYGDVITEKVDPRGRSYYWIGGAEIEEPTDEGTDLAAVARGEVSVTPIHLDLTHYELWERLQGVEIGWP